MAQELRILKINIFILFFFLHIQMSAIFLCSRYPRSPLTFIQIAYDIWSNVITKYQLRVWLRRLNVNLAISDQNSAMTEQNYKLSN